MGCFYKPYGLTFNEADCPFYLLTHLALFGYFYRNSSCDLILSLLQLKLCSEDETRYAKTLTKSIFREIKGITWIHSSLTTNFNINIIKTPSKHAELQKQNPKGWHLSLTFNGFMSVCATLSTFKQTNRYAVVTLNHLTSPKQWLEVQYLTEY